MPAAPTRRTDVFGLLALVPHTLGFQPHRSLVVVCLVPGEGERLLVGGAARLDIPTEEDSTRASQALLTMARRQGASAVLLAGYEDITGEAVEALGVLASTARAFGLTVTEVFTVHDGRYRSLMCSHPACCPSEGRPLPSTALTTEAVVEGSSPLSSRAVLESRYAAADHAEKVGKLADEIAAGGGITPDEGMAAWAVLLSDPGHHDETTAAKAALALTLTAPVHVRDALLLWLCPGVASDADEVPPGLTDLASTHLGDLFPWGGPGGTRAARAAAAPIEDALARLCASLPDHHAERVLALTGYFAWWHGDGATTVVVLDRIRAAQPLHGLADLLDRLLEAGIGAPGLMQR